MEYSSCNSYQGCLLLLSYLKLKMVDNLKASKHAPTPLPTQTHPYTHPDALLIFTYAQVLCVLIFLCVFFFLFPG